jgi:hypothetical protein
MARENHSDEPASVGVMWPSLPSTEGGGEDREDPPSAVVRPRL